MKCNTIVFPSMASITFPEGMSATMADTSLYQFAIGDEKLEISYLEYQGDLEGALNVAKKMIGILPSEQAVMKMNPPETEFDASCMEVYGKNKENQYRQLMGKSQGGYSWVLSLCGEAPALEKRSSQITALFQSLKGPEERKVDLSAMKMESICSKITELESFVKEAMNIAKVPGLSLAIIEKGEIVYTQGFGTTALCEGKEVLPSTRFMIGSITKSMTTFLIAKLEEEGVLRWDDRAAELDPDFCLSDRELSNTLTLEDLTCGVTGIPRHDLPLLLNDTGKKAEDLFADLLHLKPSSTRNEVFQYNNQLVAASGFIAAKQARKNSSYGLPEDLPLDKTFSELLKTRLFAPMEMKRSTVEFEEVMQGGNYALPHSKGLDGKTVPTHLSHEQFASYIAPAGAVWSTAEDMANYALTELNKGVFQSKRILNEEKLLYRRKPKLPIDHECKYSLGWLVGKKHGLETVEHNGGTCGFSSGFVLFPTQQSAVVLLSNSYGGFVLEPIVEEILSLWFQIDLRAKERVNANCTAWDSYLDFVNGHLFEPSKKLFESALGDHFHPELGHFKICADEGMLYFYKDLMRYRLKGYIEEGQEEKLMIVDTPFIGYVLEPVFKDGVSFKIERGQESYECRAGKVR